MICGVLPGRRQSGGAGPGLTCEALAEIKADRALRRIPVVVLTTSSDQTDIRNAYHLGANSYITTPVESARLVEVMKVLTDYWSDTVRLPEDPLRG